MLQRISLDLLAKAVFSLVLSVLLLWTSFVGQAQAFTGVSPSSGSTLSTSVNGTTLTFTHSFVSLNYDGTYVSASDPWIGGRIIVTFSEDVDISEITYRDDWFDGIEVEGYDSSNNRIATASNPISDFGSDTNLSSRASLTAFTSVRRIEIYNYRGEFDVNEIHLKNITFTASSTQDSDGDLTASATVTEPVGIDTTIDTVGEAVDVFDFTLSDGGSGDGLSMDVSQIVVNVTGTSTDSDRGKVTWRLNGNDASNVTGTYNPSADTITFSSLSLSVADGASETYTINAYYNDNSGLTEDRTFILSVDGDTDLTVGGSGTQMASTSAVTNGVGSTIDVTATALSFGTAPSGSVSGSALTTQPVVKAVDAFGNTDVDFTETVTLTEASAGTLSGASVTASSGVATFTALTYTATADGESFTLTADDQAGVGSDLSSVDASSLTSDVVATALVFSTQPAGSVSGAALTTQPVVKAVDGDGTTDTGFTETITLTEASAGALTNNTATAASGVATFSGLSYTATADGQSFTLTANDQDGVGSNLPTTDANSVTADVVATKLIFTTSPAGSVSGSALSTQPVVAAVDANNITDTDFTETVTLTEASAGTLSGDSVSAVSGVATFTALTYTATADQQSFTLTANDQDGVDTDLTSVAAGSLTSDVVATKLVFNTQPAPLTVRSATATTLTTVPVVQAVDGNDLVDTGYSTDITLSEVNGAGSATMTATGDTDGNGATVSISPSSGVATFTSMQLTYTASGTANETFNLQASSGALSTADSSQMTATSAPIITGVTSGTSDGSYKQGGAISIQVSFDQAVTVSGTPQLTLETGSTDAVVDYASGSGTSTLTFDYTVGSGETASDLDYKSTSALALNGGTIQNSGGNNADLTLPSPGALGSLGANKALVVDTTAPSLTVTSALGTLKESETTTLTFTFDEAPAGFEEADVTASNGTLSAFGVTGDTKVYTATFTPSANTEATASISVSAGAYTDTAGNSGGAGSTTIGIDTLTPTLTISSSVSEVKSGETAVITFTFSEAPAGFTDSDVSATNGTMSSVAVTSDPSVYTATFTPSTNTEGSASISVSSGDYLDAAGNSGTGHSASLDVDTQAPSLTIATGSSSLKAGETTSVTFTFDEAPSGFTNDEVSVTNGTLSTVTVTSDPMVYSATFTPSASTTDTATITVATGAYSDDAGNDGTGDNTTISIDTLVPTVTITAAASTLKSGETTVLTFAFNKTPVGFVDSNISVSAGSLSTLVNMGSDTYTATYTPPTSTTVTTTIAIADGAFSDGVGNSGTGDSIAISVDATPPTLVITSGASTLLSGETTLVTFTFTEAPTGFADADVTVTNGSLSGVTVDGSNAAVYTATFTPTSDTAGAAAIAVASGSYTDGAGNAGGSASLSLTIDTTTPSLTITSDAASLASGETALVTFTFSEAPTGFEDADIAVTNGSLSSIAVDGTDAKIYTATFTPDTGTAAASAISIASGSYTDASGNAGGAGSLTLAIDTEAPSVNITADTSSIAAGETALVTFTFSETPNGFADEDIAVTNGTLSSITVDSSNAKVYTATFTPDTETATSATLSVAAGSYTDSVGNNGSAGTLSLTLDTAAPSLSITAAATALVSGETTVISFDFSEAPMDFADADITVTNGSLSSISVDSSDATLYTATFTPDEDSTGTAAISVAAGSYTDAVGNAGAAAALTLTLDTITPTVAVNVLSPSLKAGETSMVSFTFSEAPKKFTSNDIWATSGSLSGITQDGSNPLVYWAEFTPSGNASETVEIGISDAVYRDAAGNWGTGDSMMVSVDTAAPTLTISSGKTALKAGQTARITFTFSEVPTGFAKRDIIVRNGSLGKLRADSDPKVYTAKFTPDAAGDGTAKIRVKAGKYTDAMGNAGAAAVLTLDYDTVVPDVVLTGPTSLVTGAFEVTATFTENVTGFAAKDISINNGEVVSGSFSGSGASYTFEVDPKLGSDVSIQIASGIAKDAGGNRNTASNTLTVSAGSPESAMETRTKEVKSNLRTSMSQNLRSQLSTNIRLTRDASTRFIQSRQLMSGRALSFVGQNYIPFSIDGSVEASRGSFETDGRFFSQVGSDDGRFRRVFFGDFDVQAKDDEQLKLSLNARVAWEHMVREDLMLGYFIGGAADRSELSGTYEGTLSGLEASIGAYALKSFGESLFADGFMSFGLGRTQMDISDDVLNLEGDYWTRTATVGAALTGTIGFERFDFWPEISATYAHSSRPDAKVTGRAYGITDTGLVLEGDEVSIATVRIRPQIRVPVLADAGTRMNSIVTIAPTLSCERVMSGGTTESCGNGMELGLSSISRDGNSVFELRFNVDRTDENVQRGMRLAVEHKF